jgi:ABC-type Fe3+-hydroxamate transport system substrate-binding protein
LSRVAPVVPTNLLTWREDLQQVAGWLNREARLEQTFQAYDALRDGLKRKHAARLPAARVAFGSFEPPNLLLRDFDNTTGPATQALAELGGRLLPLPVAASRPGFYTVSLENLQAMAAADGILIWAPDETARNLFLQSPLWPLLPAVQAGRAVVSPNNIGQGSVYTVMECLRLWDQVYSALP